MRWDCGETWPEEVARCREWHRWFAWHPVEVADHDCRWLEWVECRGWPEEWGGEVRWNWEYRAVSD